MNTIVYFKSLDSIKRCYFFDYCRRKIPLVPMNVQGRIAYQIRSKTLYFHDFYTVLPSFAYFRHAGYGNDYGFDFKCRDLFVHRYSQINPNIPVHFYTKSLN